MLLFSGASIRDAQLSTASEESGNGKIESTRRVEEDWKPVLREGPGRGIESSLRCESVRRTSAELATASVPAHGTQAAASRARARLYSVLGPGGPAGFDS